MSGERVLVRAPSAAFVRALSEHAERGRIDPARALVQHAGFVAALRAAGAEVVELPAEPELPDAPFVSDCLLALPHDGRARTLVVTRPGAESRRGEVASVAAAARRLAPGAEVVAIEPPGTLEAGDVVVFGRRLAVGLSARTNEEGAAQLARVANRLGYEAFACPVRDRLHLATAVTAIGSRRLIGTRAGFASLDEGGALEPEIERLVIPDEELPGANVLALAGSCFLPAGNPQAAGLLRARGERVVELDLSEFTRADGGPTCLVNLIGGG